MDENDPERPRVVKEIETLTNKLGTDMTNLEITLARGPGRPRKLADISEHEAALAKVQEELNVDETPRAKEIRVNKKVEDLKARVLAANPELAAQKEKEERSERELNEMIQRANDELAAKAKQGGNDEGRKQATDDVGGAKANN